MSALLDVCRGELRRIFALRPVFSVLILASAVYAVFYPQPYLNEALRDVPIALVDQDRTASSRELARRIDASSDVAVAMTVADVPAAQRAVYGRAVSGILVIPQHFERDLLHGRPSPIALYADASYFLIYQRLSGGVSAVTRAFGAEIETKRLVALGVDPAIAVAAADPLVLTAVPLFNPQGGYATYVLPAAFILILQQTLLIAVGLLGTHPGADDFGRGAVATVCGKLLAYLAVESVIVPFYLIVLPWLYGFPRLGAVLDLLLFALPFVLAVSALGLLVAALFRHPIVVQLVFAAVGLPFFFLAGFAWPSEAIPQPLQWAAALLPSSSAIDGLVRIGQLGASLPIVRGQYFTLWALAACYGAIAVVLQMRRYRTASDAPRRSAALTAA